MLLCFFQRKQKWRMEAIFPFIMLTFIATLYEQIGTGWLRINTVYWYYLYSFLEFSTIYYYLLGLFRRKNKVLFKVFAGAFVIMYSCSFLFWDENNVLLPKMIDKIVITLLVLTFSFKWFKELFKKTEVPDLWSNGNFYFVSGLLIYYSATFVLFMLSSFLIEVSEHFYDYWLVNVIATLFLRIILSLGVWNTRTV